MQRAKPPRYTPSSAAAPETVLRRVQEAVDGFVQDAEQFDDLTMLCLEYRGPQPDEKET